MLIRINSDGSAVVVSGPKDLEHRVFEPKDRQPKEKETVIEPKNQQQKVDEAKKNLEKTFTRAIINKFANKLGVLTAQSASTRFSESKAKKTVTHILDLAKKQIAGEPINTGLTDSEAQEIINTSESVQNALGEGNVRKVKKAIVSAKKALIGLLEDDSFTQKNLSPEEQNAREARLAANWAFYDNLEQAQTTARGKVSVTYTRALQKGSSELLNTIAESYGLNIGNADQFISVVGIDMAAAIVNASLNDSERQAIKIVYQENAEKIVNDSLNSAIESKAVAERLYELAKDGTLNKSQAGLALSRVSKEATESIAFAAGSLRMGAALVNTLGQFSVSTREKAEEIMIMAGLKNKARIVENKNGTFGIILNRIIDSEIKKDDIVSRLSKGEVINSGRTDGMPEKKADGSPNIKLSDAQNDGVAFILGDEKSKGVGRGILNFGAGIGKTVTYLAIVAKMKADGQLSTPAIIAVPSRLRTEFGNDQKNFFHNLSMLNIDSVGKSMGLTAFNEKFGTNLSKEEFAKASSDDLRKIAVEKSVGRFDIILTGHDTAKNSSLMKAFTDLAPSITIVDESHEIVTPDSIGQTGQSQKMKAFQELAKKSDKFVAGTGTLIRQSFNEVADIVAMVRPDMEAQAKDLSKRVSVIAKNRGVFEGIAKQKISETLKDVILTRSTDLSSATGSPALIREKKHVKLSDKQSSAFRKAEDRYIFEKNNAGKIGFESASGTLSNITATQDQINAAGGVENFIKANNLEGRKPVKLGGDEALQRKIAAQRDAIYGGKWNNNALAVEMVNSLKEHFSSGKEGKASVFYSKEIKSAAKPTIEAALKQGLGLKEGQYVFIDGDVSHKQRAIIKEKYQKDPNVKVIVFNDAGATGLNLQAGTHMVYYSPASSAAVDEQAYRRHYRTGQQKDVKTVNLELSLPSAIAQSKKIETQKRMIGIFDNSKTIAKAAQVTYTDYPRSAAENAKKVIKWKQEHGDEVKAMTPVGWLRANQIANMKPISLETVKRIAAFERHRQNSKLSPENKHTPWKDNGYVAWLGWGGDEMIAWAKKIVAEKDLE